jgi:hypothetical protein
MNKISLQIVLALIVLLSVACRHDEVTIPSDADTIIDFPDEDTGIAGFFLLNEGNMGSNKCTLDHFDWFTGFYRRNIYAETNPSALMELGDVGNDIAVYGSKVYIVVNCSHKVEVLDLRTARRLGQIDIPNCRYLAFDGPNAYVSSYIGPVADDPDCPRGAVFRVDTTSLAVTGRCPVGYQPEEMAVIGRKLYVANSGGYRPPVYDRTVSVVDLDSFTEERRIDVAINLHRLRPDSRGRLWVSSRGNREATILPSLHMLAPDSDGRMALAASFPDVHVTNMAVGPESIYYIYAVGPGRAVYDTFDLDRLTPRGHSFIDDATAQAIRMPYALALHPETGNIFLSDARNYVSSGELYCITPAGSTKWHVRTGDIPAAIAFIKK